MKTFAELQNDKDAVLKRRREFLQLVYSEMRSLEADINDYFHIEDISVHATGEDNFVTIDANGGILNISRNLNNDKFDLIYKEGRVQPREQTATCATEDELLEAIVEFVRENARP